MVFFVCVCGGFWCVFLSVSVGTKSRAFSRPQHLRNLKSKSARCAWWLFDRSLHEGTQAPSIGNTRAASLHSLTRVIYLALVHCLRSPTLSAKSATSVLLHVDLRVGTASSSSLPVLQSWESATGSGSWERSYKSAKLTILESSLPVFPPPQWGYCGRGD